MGCRKWTNAEDEVLIAHFSTTPYNEIGKRLLRTPKAIECRVTKLVQRGRLDASKRFIPTQERVLSISRDTLRNQLTENIFCSLVESNLGISKDSVKNLFEQARQIANNSLNDTWKQ